jgi:hypothetical protein
VQRNGILAQKIQKIEKSFRIAILQFKASQAILDNLARDNPKLNTQILLNEHMKKCEELKFSIMVYEDIEYAHVQGEKAKAEKEKFALLNNPDEPVTEKTLAKIGLFIEPRIQRFFELLEELNEFYQQLNESKALIFNLKSFTRTNVLKSIHSVCLESQRNLENEKHASTHKLDIENLKRSSELFEAYQHSPDGKEDISQYIPDEKFIPDEARLRFLKVHWIEQLDTINPAIPIIDLIRNTIDKFTIVIQGLKQEAKMQDQIDKLESDMLTLNGHSMWLKEYSMRLNDNKKLYSKSKYCEAHEIQLQIEEHIRDICRNNILNIINSLTEEGRRLSVQFRRMSSLSRRSSTSSALALLNESSRSNGNSFSDSSSLQSQASASPRLPPLTTSTSTSSEHEIKDSPITPSSLRI